MKCELPDDNIIKIAQFLDLKDIINLTYSCKTHNVVQQIITNKISQWYMWYNKQCTVVPCIKIVENGIRKITLYRDFLFFLFSNDNEIKMNISTDHVKWFQYVCIALRINIYSDKSQYIIKKPHNGNIWMFPSEIVSIDAINRGKRRLKAQKYRRDCQKKNTILVRKMHLLCNDD